MATGERPVTPKKPLIESGPCFEMKYHESGIVEMSCQAPPPLEAVLLKLEATKKPPAESH